jgi:hypothetical protein
VSIHRINGSNIGQVLPLLRLAAEDIFDIQSSVAAGKEVTVSESEVKVGGYRGVGLLILDPDRGDGLYLISGGLSGGATFTLKEWKKDVYNKVWAGLTVRNLVLGWARSKTGTPYGFGCKDTFVNDWQSARCASKYGPDTIRIDCSGLVEFAYYMVGFKFFVQKNAQGQFDFVRSNFSIPDANSVLFGDIIVFENTYDKNENNIRTDDGVTHIGIVDKPQKWVAAESKMVESYCTSGFKAANSADACIVSGLWPGKYANFFSYGSVISGR